MYWTVPNESIFCFSINSLLNFALVLHFSSANKCLLKVAAYAAQLEQYQKAIEIYEQVRPVLSLVEVTLKNLLFKFSFYQDVVHTLCNSFKEYHVSGI